MTSSGRNPAFVATRSSPCGSRPFGHQSGVKVYGSERFRALTRNPALPVPARFEPTQKHPDDVVI